MPPWLEFTTTVLDVLAFVFVTPLVIGKDRLVQILSRYERLHDWIRFDWFGHDRAPFNLSQLAGMVLLVGLVGLALVGVVVPPWLYPALFTLGICILPAVCVVGFWIVRWSALRSGLDRTLALIGGLLFMSGKSLVAISSLSRMFEP